MEVEFINVTNLLASLSLSVKEMYDRLIGVYFQGLILCGFCLFVLGGSRIGYLRLSVSLGILELTRLALNLDPFASASVLGIKICAASPCSLCFCLVSHCYPVSPQACNLSTLSSSLVIINMSQMLVCSFLLLFYMYGCYSCMYDYVPRAFSVQRDKKRH